MNKDIFKPYKIWFVTGSQHLYGPETLQQVAENSQKIIKGLNNSQELAVELIWKDTVKTGSEILQVIREANVDNTCIGLITWMHTFSPAKMWINGLVELQKPFCQLHTQFNRDIPWKTIDMDFMNLNQTAHGGREFGFIGSRLRLNRKVIVGHWEDPKVRTRIDAWMRAASAVADGRNLSVARFGDNMREVAVTEGDKVEAQKVFGYSVSGYGLGDLKTYIDSVSDSEIDDLTAKYKALYQMGPNLNSDKGKQRIRTGARLEIGMCRFLEDGGFKALTTTFENLHGLDQLPGLACQRLMADGYGFGAEGDWKTAALVRAMKVMGAGLKGGCTFMEDYTYHLDPKDPMVLGAHMLEVCPSIAKGTIHLDAQPLGIGGKDDPVRLIFDSGAAQAINVSVMDMGNRFRLLMNEVEAIDIPAQLPNLPVARVVWKPKPDLETAAAAWIYSGGSHHTGFSQALTSEHLIDYATILGIELIKIDTDTHIETIKNELRWNDLYYHLKIS